VLSFIARLRGTTGPVWKFRRKEYFLVPVRVRSPYRPGLETATIMRNY
jgi:hypothetical protein